ncbi:membrane-bound alkaline phosphatase-like, partial [Agrilus planipennis]|uniref:Alkaline phosphatase n=1 Tax=Agrilus planipennis TaxID=224129 RepID=A0A1W4X350_AGRPL
ILLCIIADPFSHPFLERAVHDRDFSAPASVSPVEKTAAFWKSSAQQAISNKLKTINYNTGKAKNIILFMGDGMSLPTVTASRIYKGQNEGRSGEEQQLSFEQFPFMGLSKTYCADSQVTDSAASATAYLTGVKTNYNAVGVSAAVTVRDCAAMLDENNHVSSIAEWAQNAGMRTGLVTTARVTHASPAPLYAHSSYRNWESDTDILRDGEDPRVCRDIASQMIFNNVGQKMNVIFGGGKSEFFNQTASDENGNAGYRSDGVNLIDTWKNLKAQSGSSYAYVYNREGLLNLTNEDHVLGLFTSDHMNYELDRNADTEPSVAEMTEAAIKLLSKGDEGFFLFVEGARIDMAHHNLLAVKALAETVAFSKAVSVAENLTNSEETLIVVTADHAHTMTINGYPSRGNDIKGISGAADDGLPYLTLSYANGVYNGLDSNSGRHNLTGDPALGTKDYVYPGMVYRRSETHGGDDVGIFSKGPWAHLLTGVNEQNVIPHVMAYAACIGDGDTMCVSGSENTMSHMSVSLYVVVLSLAIYFGF